MTPRVVAIATAVIFGVIAWFVVGALGYLLWGCDEGACPTPTWQWALRWGVPLLVALVAGRWADRRAELTRRATGR